MKTLDELFEELNNSDELKKELAVITEKKDLDALQNWLKGQGCDATVAEAKEFLLAKEKEFSDDRELSPDELEQAAGGFIIEGMVGAVTIVSGISAGWAMFSVSDC